MVLASPSRLDGFCEDWIRGRQVGSRRGRESRTGVPSDSAAAAPCEAGLAGVGRRCCWTVDVRCRDGREEPRALRRHQSQSVGRSGSLRTSSTRSSVRLPQGLQQLRSVGPVPRARRAQPCVRRTRPEGFPHSESLAWAACSARFRGLGAGRVGPSPCAASAT
jgi:hypothetical protein